MFNSTCLSSALHGQKSSTWTLGPSLVYLKSCCVNNKEGPTVDDDVARRGNRIKRTSVLVSGPEWA